MKILFISSRYEGGLGGHAARVAAKMIETGFDVRLMHVPHVPVKGLKNPSFSLFSTIMAAVNRERFDVVHAFGIPAAFAMRCTRAKKRILSVHGMYSRQMGALHPGIGGRLVKCIEPRALGWADRLTTDSKSVQRQYRERLGADFYCMYGPLATEDFEDVPDVPRKEKQIAYVGRDSYEKGTDILRGIEGEIDADIVYCTDMKWRDAMTKLKESRVLVVPSRMESSPHVIREAFFLRVPVVATDVDGIPEMVRHEQTGLLVPPDQPEELRDAIVRLMSDERLAERLADNGYEFVVRNLTWDALLPRYVKFYESMLGQ